MQPILAAKRYVSFFWVTLYMCGTIHFGGLLLCAFICNIIFLSLFLIMFLYPSLVIFISLVIFLSLSLIILLGNIFYVFFILIFLLQALPPLPPPTAANKRISVGESAKLPKNSTGEKFCKQISDPRQQTCKHVCRQTTFRNGQMLHHTTPCGDHLIRKGLLQLQSLSMNG